jgi:predicted GTPase
VGGLEVQDGKAVERIEAAMGESLVLVLVLGLATGQDEEEGRKLRKKMNEKSLVLWIVSRMERVKWTSGCVLMSR